MVRLFRAASLRWAEPDEFIELLMIEAQKQPLDQKISAAAANMIKQALDQKINRKVWSQESLSQVSSSYLHHQL
eukprot:COSAG05_NODE_2107_length_3551_cov_3.251738_4_plen_74_part_00